MPLYPHQIIDSIPDWVECDPGETVTHAIQIATNTYILHIESQYEPCFLCSQWLDPEENRVKWMHTDHMAPNARDIFQILLTLCERLIHGDKHE